MRKNFKLERRLQRRYVISSEIGFTLTEMMIAIAIATILFSGGLVSYQDFNDRQTVKDAGQTVKSVLRNVQQKALQGEKPAGTVCTVLDGYQVAFTDSTMRVTAQCSDGPGPVEITKLPNDVTFSPVPSTFLFKVLGDGVDTGVTIDIVGSDRFYELIISPTGEIQDNEMTTI